jgi:septal ring factor EnvC (AmiA/AmiB activator)
VLGSRQASCTARSRANHVASMANMLALFAQKDAVRTKLDSSDEVFVQVEKEKDALRAELNKARQQLKETDAAVAAQAAELGKLNHIINEADEERLRQKKEYDIVINERDILGAALRAHAPLM